VYDPRLGCPEDLGNGERIFLGVHKIPFSVSVPKCSLGQFGKFRATCVQYFFHAVYRTKGPEAVIGGISSGRNSSPEIYNVLTLEIP